MQYLEGVFNENSKHYQTKKDCEVHDVMLNIQTKQIVSRRL